jgi:hypothetical protein
MPKAKQKSCNRGYPCGGSCISRGFNCRKKLAGQGKNYADWLKTQGDRLGGRLLLPGSTEPAKKPTVNAKRTARAPGGNPGDVSSKKTKPLTTKQIKTGIYDYFKVKNATELQRSGQFKMAISGMDNLDLKSRSGWESLHRKFIGVLPEEKGAKDYGSINGVNVFKYFKPWEVFGLDPKTASQKDIKDAYKKLSKVYHPDIAGTGDKKIFNEINTMYRSIAANP